MILDPLGFPLGCAEAVLQCPQGVPQVRDLSPWNRSSCSFPQLADSVQRCPATKNDKDHCHWMSLENIGEYWGIEYCRILET